MSRRALVTGGSAGLGAAFVAELISLGFEVVSIDRNLPERDVDHQHTLQADLSNVSDIQPLLSAFSADSQFDVVVFNAGISAVGAFEAIGMAQLDKVIAVNLLAPMELARVLLTRHLLTSQASLIFIGSLSNRVGYPGASVYAATKQGIEAFATSLRKTGKHKVLCVLPGPLDTDHASRYAPGTSKGGKRQAPSVLAARVLRHRHRSGTVYGTLGHRLAGHLGMLAPALVTGLMRRGLFTKLRVAPPVTDERL